MPRQLISPTGKPKILAPVRANLGIEAAYRRQLDRYIDAMQDSIVYRLKATYRANPPELAQDVSPAMAFRDTMRKLTSQWIQKFDEMAPKLAAYFSTQATDRADGALASILKRGGMSVKFTLTRAANDVLQASIGANVALIKSIASEHLKNVEGIVMRAVQAGGDLGPLSKELQSAYGVTKRRAAFIAFDQSKKATAAIVHTRQEELGITRAMWQHSGGGKTQRPSHVKASRDRVSYDVRKGWYDPAAKQWIYPGELPGCRCVSRSVVPGFN